MLGVVINMYIYVNYLLSIISTFDDIVNPLYNRALGDHFFFLTLINYDSNVYSHIPYKPLQDCDYKQKGCPPIIERKKSSPLKI
jgi:hypothetical protein